MNEDPRISKSQLDKLGSRLRNSVDPNDDDLVLLNHYRERFIPINDSILSDLRQLTDLAIESRHKSVPSIVAKLRRRQPARLSAIQDLAGARIIVSDLRAQDRLVDSLVHLYPRATVDDKRAQPMHSYRAVHIILQAPLPYEIQVRTELQHAWAQLSERLADRYGFELKYGGGPEPVARALAEFAEFADTVARITDHRESHPETLVGTLKRYVERLPIIMEVLEL